MTQISMNTRTAPAKLLEEMDKFGHLLSELTKGQEAIYFPNPGNLGDGLIRYGTLRFFKNHNIKYREITTFRNPPATLFGMLLSRNIWIYGGGGGWIAPHAAEKIVQKTRIFSKRTIVLPSTYGYSVKEQSRITHFRRDLYQSAENAPHSIFAHDMALYSELADATPIRKKGYFWRNDCESSYASEGMESRPDIENRDISAEGIHVTPIDGFVSGIAEVEEVVTDRLHVAICGAILGRKVTLYRNSYFKNESVFKTSIEPHFPNVTFINSKPQA